jgi:hypothetical protein
MSADPTAHAPEGPLPAVHDEATDTPTWLPVTGLVLFLMMLFWMLYRGANPEPEVVPEGAPADAAEVEAPAEAPAE